MRTLILTAALVLALPMAAQAQDSWIPTDSGGGTESAASTADVGVTYVVTATGATTAALNTSQCVPFGGMVAATNLAGTNVNPQVCWLSDCSDAVDVGSAADPLLDDGDAWVMDYWFPFFRVIGMTSSDVVKFTCARSK